MEHIQFQWENHGKLLVSWPCSIAILTRLARVVLDGGTSDAPTVVNPPRHRVPCMLGDSFQRYYQGRHKIRKIPSGKRLNSYRKSTCLMGKCAMNGHFQ